MPLEPNPELYPPYGGQTYIKVHEQDLKGVTANHLAPVDYTTQKYAFCGHNPRFEIAQTIDAYKQNTEEFTACDTGLTTYLAGRVTTHAETVYTYVKSKVPNQDSNQQYVLGFTAAMGGGQNTTYFANSISVAQNMEMVYKAVEVANGLPIVTPFESPLILPPSKPKTLVRFVTSNSDSPLNLLADSLTLGLLALTFNTLGMVFP